MRCTTRDHIVDLVINWINNKNAFYVIESDSVMYFETPTSRVQDSTWREVSPKRLARIIFITMQGAEDTPATEVEVITALQELGVIYDYSVRTNVEVAENVVNLNKYEVVAWPNLIAANIADYLYNNNFRMVGATKSTQLIERVAKNLGLETGKIELSIKLEKALEEKGYILRNKVDRPAIKGKKLAVYTLPNTQPKEYVELDKIVHGKEITNIIKG